MGRGWTLGRPGADSRRSALLDRLDGGRSPVEALLGAAWRASRLRQRLGVA
jgi:hypothetical protein